MRISSLALLLPIALAACTGTMSTPGPAAPAAPEPPAPPAAPAAPEIAAELPRFHWRLQEATTADGTRIEALFARADKPVQLDFDKGRLAVSNTCNRMGGSYAIAGGTLTVGRMASTMMACADAKLMALDGEVGKRLEGALSLALVAGETPQLTLGNTVGDRLVFAGTPTAATRYGGPGERMFLEVAAQTKPCSHPLIPDMQCLQVRELAYDDHGLKVGTPRRVREFLRQHRRLHPRTWRAQRAAGAALHPQGRPGRCVEIRLCAGHGGGVGRQRDTVTVTS
jgi:heat shock protein HslJ